MDAEELEPRVIEKTSDGVFAHIRKNKIDADPTQNVWVKTGYAWIEDKIKVSKTPPIDTTAQEVHKEIEYHE